MTCYRQLYPMVMFQWLCMDRDMLSKTLSSQAPLIKFVLEIVTKGKYYFSEKTVDRFCTNDFFFSVLMFLQFDSA